MRSIVITSMLALPLMLAVKSDAQAQPVATAPQTQPAATAPQAQPAPHAQPAVTQAQAMSPARQVPAMSARLQVMGGETPAQAPAQPVVHVTGRVDEKSAGLALGGSLVTTGLGLGVMIAGIGSDNGALGLVGFSAALIGPSFGHFYAGEYGRGLVHTGVRAGAAVMTVAGFWWSVDGFIDCLFSSGDEIGCNANPTAPLLLAGGLVLGTGSIVYGIYDAPKAAHRHNARARARQFSIMPAPITGPERSTGVGLRLGGQF